MLTACSSSSGTAEETSAASDTSEAEIKNERVLTLDSEDDIDTVYTLDYQNTISEKIEEQKSSQEYTIDDPLIIADPYGTNTTGLYVYFTTDTATELSYTVSADGYEDFTQTVSGGYTTVHEHQLVGMIAGETNTITMTLTDESGNETGIFTLEYTAPELLGDEENGQLEVTSGDSSEALSDGFYTMLGNRTEEDNEQVDFILIYDNNGTLRSEIPIRSYRSCRLLFDGATMYYSTSADQIAALDNTGQITALYDTGDYNLHHDYIFGSDNDFLVLSTDTTSNTEEDRIISIDRESGEVTELIDLADLFADYFNSLENDEEDFDWMHINSLCLVGEDSLILSSRETSSIIKINDIYSDPSVEYLISSDEFWDGTGYENLLLKQIGDFTLQAGQHCVTYETSDELSDGQYYLTMYNNNNATISTRDYGYVSSVQQLGDNLLTDSGSAFEASEFDKDHNLIQTLTGAGATWWYRVFKYDYSGYWFA